MNDWFRGRDAVASAFAYIRNNVNWQHGSAYDDDYLTRPFSHLDRTRGTPRSSHPTDTHELSKPTIARAVDSRISIRWLLPRSRLAGGRWYRQTEPNGSWQNFGPMARQAAGNRM
jgi:hypothetical protein